MWPYKECPGAPTTIRSLETATAPPKRSWGPAASVTVSAAPCWDQSCGSRLGSARACVAYVTKQVAPMSARMASALLPRNRALSVSMNSEYGMATVGGAAVRLVPEDDDLHRREHVCVSEIGRYSR